MPGRPHRVKSATSHFREPSLSTLTRGEVVSCEHLDTDRYGRVIGRCHVGDADLGAKLVSIGLALAYRRYSTDYVPQETTAKADKRGIWAGSFVAPWDWRRGVRLGVKDVGAPAGCAIKGNVSQAGERIYHVPGGRWYDRTKIEVGKGERRFCTEDEAIEAGWRRAR